jgi:S-DNA-T family DNA segregation ATPase FtsK/SpoIIIE
MSHEVKQYPLFEEVKKMVVETRTPSISLAQRTFRIGYSRAAKMLEALEGDVVTVIDERGCRKMLAGDTIEYL